LLPDHRIPGCPRNFLSASDGILHGVGRGRQHQFRAEQRQHLVPLDRHRIRRHQGLVDSRGAATSAKPVLLEPSVV
jgi:hypothetical protein